MRWCPASSGSASLPTGRLLQRVLGSTYPGLDEEGWKKLTRNWAIFFAFMAVLNEAVWRNSSTNFWIGFKLWGALPLTFLFAAANIPMLLRHGLMKEDAVPAEPGPSNERPDPLHPRSAARPMAPASTP